MAACSRCGLDTELYSLNIPVCPRCADIIDKTATSDQPMLKAKAFAMASGGNPGGVKRSG